jgi:hypothetical protein
VSKWNVPDWRDPTQYPSARSLRQWAWEFLRRNPVYRAGWLACIEPFFDPARNVDPTHGVPVAQQAVLVHQFGLESFPPSPDDDYPPRFKGTGLRWTEEREAHMVIDPGQIAVIFDLTRPLKWQVRALWRLFAEQREQAGLAHKNRTDRFPSYLRILDADDADATNAEIGDTLFGDRLTDAKFTVRDYRKAATRLRDTDYLFVAAGEK